jgi:hypothetical protein
MSPIKVLTVYFVYIRILTLQVISTCEGFNLIRLLRADPPEINRCVNITHEASSMTQITQIWATNVVFGLV